MFLFLVILVVAYLFGSVPFGFLVVKLRKGIDIRTVGSGNIGATNVKRVLGKPAFVLVFILDAAKGLLPVWLSMYVFAWPNWETTLVGVVAVLGHLFPVFLGFKGGKAVSTISGIFVILNPVALGIAVVVFCMVYWTTSFVSLGSLVAALIIPIVAVCQPGAWSDQRVSITILSLIVLIIVLYTHRANIRRLLKGEENKA